jgi:hypothetical protein
VFVVLASWLVILDDSSNVFSLVIDSSDMVVLVDSSNVCISFGLLVMFDSSNVLIRFVWLIVVSLSNVLDSLVVYVMYVSMYEGRANYQYYALQGSE